ncbi:MAG: beta strand repeat-containing protein [Thermoguttaceae bacterium]
MCCWFGEIVDRCLRALQSRTVVWLAIAVMAAGGGRALAQPVSTWSTGNQILYDPTTGNLSLVNNVPSAAVPGLDDFTVYLANPASVPSTAGSATQQWMNQYGWSYYGISFPGEDIEMDFDKQGFGQGVDVLPPGTYLLANLPTGLGASDFGNSFSSSYDSSNNQLGSVYYGSDVGTDDFQTVGIVKTVSAENDWIGASGALWGTSGNWSLAASTSIHRVPTAADTATFGNQYGSLGVGTGGTVNVSGTQTVGSLAFNCTNSYTIQPTAGTTGLLSLSSGANITIDAGLHTIAVPLALSGSLTVDAEGNGSAGLTVSGQISGTSSLIKTGPGTLWLSNTNNTYNGNTQIDGGTLTAAGSGSLGASGSVTICNGTLDFSNSGTFARSIVLSGSGANAIQADTGLFTLSGAISGSGGLTKAGIGTLAIAGSSNSFSGGTTITAGTLQLQAATALNSTSGVSIANGAVLNLNGLSPSLANLSGGGTVTNGKPSTTSTLTAAYASGAASYAAAIQDGAGKVALNVPSGGSLTLCNTANTFSGGSTVSGGTLGISADGNLGGPASGVSLDDGTLLLGGSGNFTVASGRGISLTGSSAIGVVSGQSATIAGVVSGGTLTMTEGGTLSLTNTKNSYSGGTVINGGTLAVANDSSLGAPGGSVTINNGTFQVSGGASNRNLNLGSFPILQVAAGTYTEAGLVSDSTSNVLGALIKTGPGTLMLTNTNNSFSNGITVQAGTLLVNDPTGLALGSGSITVSGGSLAGSGTIQPAVTMSSGNLMAGDSNTMGTLTFQNGLTIKNYEGQTSWTLKIDDNGNCDSLDFGSTPYVTNQNSALVLSSSSLLVVSGAAMPPTGVPYTIITDDHVNSVNLNNLKVQAPIGYTASLASFSGYQSVYFPNNMTVTLTFAGPTEWTQAGGGDWSTGANWSGGNVPRSSANPASPNGAVVLFGASGYGTVSLPGSAVTCINTLVFANSSNSYTLAAAPGGSALFSRSGFDPLTGGFVDNGAAFVEVVSGQHTIAANAKLGCAVDVSTLDTEAEMTFSGALSGTGGLVLSGSGSVILSGNNSYSGGTTVEGGTLHLYGTDAIPNGSALTVGGGGASIFNASAKAISSIEPDAAGAAGPAVSPVPEPGTLATLTAGALCCLAARSWRRRRGRQGF